MRHLRVILPFTLLLFSLACLKDNPLGIDQGFSQIHVTIGLPEVEPVSAPDTALYKAAAVYTVILTVTADDMETIEEELDISSDGETASGTVQVPKGEERTFTIVIKDQDDITRFEGSNTVDVLKGSKTVSIVATGLYSNVTVNVNILAKQLNPSGPTNSLSKIVVVTNVVLSVSASDMETIEAYLTVGSGGETASGTADVPKGNNRTFEILCKDANGVVQYSGSTTQDVLAATATVSITTEGHYPSASTLTITGITFSTVTLAWTQNTDSDFQDYEIYRSLSPGVDINSDFITTISSQSTVSYVDDTVSPNTTYYYRVRVTDTEDLGSWSNEVSDQTPGRPPDAVTLSITGITSNTVTLAWTQNTDSDFQAYEIYRSLSSGVDINSDFITTISSQSTVSYVDNTVSHSTTYYYRVRVTDTEGLDSWSNEVSDQTLVVVMQEFTSTLNWDLPSLGWAYTYFTINNFAPSGSAVTDVEYFLRIDDRGDPNYFWCGDYEIYISSSPSLGALKDDLVYDNLGGRTDGGFDDDADDDSDIYLVWRSTSYFNEEDPNQYWGIYIVDTMSGDYGYVDEIGIRIYYEVPSSSPGLITIKVPASAADEGTSLNENHPSVSAQGSIEPVSTGLEKVKSFPER